MRRIAIKYTPLSYNYGSELILKANPYYWDGPRISEIDVPFVSNSGPHDMFVEINGKCDFIQRKKA